MMEIFEMVSPIAITAIAAYAGIFLVIILYIVFLYPKRIGDIKMIINGISSRYATTSGVYLGVSIPGLIIILDSCIYGYYNIKEDYNMPIGLFNCFILGIYFVVKLFKNNYCKYGIRGIEISFLEFFSVFYFFWICLFIKVIRDIVEYIISFIQEGFTFKNISGKILWMIYIKLLSKLGDYAFLKDTSQCVINASPQNPYIKPMHKILYCILVCAFVAHELYKFKKEDYAFSSYIIIFFSFIILCITGIEVKIIEFVYNYNLLEL